MEPESCVDFKEKKRTTFQKSCLQAKYNPLTEWETFKTYKDSEDESFIYPLLKEKEVLAKYTTFNIF